MSSADASPAIRCAEVTRRYGSPRSGSGSRSQSKTTVTAVDDVSCAVMPGEVVVLAGPSGSGKSTLLHLMAALDTPSSGTVHVAGTDVTTLSEHERTRFRLDRIGIVFQRFHLLSALTARANISLPLIELGHSQADRHSRAETLLTEVGLGDRGNHRPAELSGGEQQRVAVARALVADPDVIVADEPTGELDAAASDTVIQLLQSVATDRAVVIASHDPAVIEAADRVLRLHDGRFSDENPPAPTPADE
ncbi:ATP-binding cassette domain-containing protein [Halosegnis longus]|uniref:ATP-binding cassette domain-containing protein n=1 Tax=Halosegnis longus TaxID=2216012 RepID=UPI00096A80C0|nr:ABC transporter ATP-binding protein [Salella cibi]